MAHGSLQNNKRRWTRTRYQPMRSTLKNRHLRHAAYLTAKLQATQIRASSGVSGAICRRSADLLTQRMQLHSRLLA